MNSDPGIRLLLVALTGILPLILAVHAPRGWGAEREQPVIGEVEEVMLLDWGIPLKARVDTGAATASLDARQVRVRGTGRARVVRFTLPTDDGRRMTLDLPLVEYRKVTTADGGTQDRPVVRLRICLAGVQLPVDFTLNDRSRVEHRMLLGRNLLAGRFLVDVSRSLTARPVCPFVR